MPHSLLSLNPLGFSSILIPHLLPPFLACLEQGDSRFMPRVALEEVTMPGALFEDDLRWCGRPSLIMWWSLNLVCSRPWLHYYLVHVLHKNCFQNLHSKPSSKVFSPILVSKNCFQNPFLKFVFKLIFKPTILRWS